MKSCSLFPESSALYLATEPDKVREERQWTLTNHLLAGIFDVLSWLRWAKTEDGANNRRPPKPLPRPGIEDPDTTRIRGDKLPADEMIRFLGGPFIDLLDPAEQAS